MTTAMNTALMTQTQHLLTANSMLEPFPQHCQQVLLGMGCFWGAERRFWQQAGVYVTAVGYGGGHDSSPDYQKVCTGTTNHVELVLVVYDPASISFDQLLSVFWESHDPTQGLRQGNDVGSQYRSAIYVNTEQQLNTAIHSKTHYAAALAKKGLPTITTEIAMADSFYYAEDYHQQYLAKNPSGYCGLKGTGVSCSI